MDHNFLKTEKVLSIEKMSPTSVPEYVEEIRTISKGDQGDSVLGRVHAFE